jgi:hypothetical protein
MATSQPCRRTDHARTQPRTPDRDTAALPDGYNEVAYISDPNGACHPNRLAAIGRLLGLDTAPIANCRVPELAASALLVR